MGTDRRQGRHDNDYEEEGAGCWGLSVVAGDNDHFRRQLVLEVVRAGQAVAVAAHIHHLVRGPG